MLRNSLSGSLVKASQTEEITNVKTQEINE